MVKGRGNMDTYKKVIDIVVDITGCEELLTNQDIDLLEEDILDSYAFIELIDTLDTVFEIEIEPTQVNKETWRSVRMISNMVEEMLKDKGI